MQALMLRLYANEEAQAQAISGQAAGNGGYDPMKDPNKMIVQY